MSKLKAHQIFFIESKIEQLTPQELADELEVPLAGVRAVIRKIKKSRSALPPIPPSEENTQQPAAQFAEKPDDKPVEKSKLPPSIPGVRASTVFMTESDSNRYDKAPKASPLASPRLKKCVSVVDPDAPVY